MCVRVCEWKGGCEVGIPHRSQRAAVPALARAAVPAPVPGGHAGPVRAEAPRSPVAPPYT